MFSWIPIYAEIAHRVLEFEGRQSELIDLLVGLQKKGHKVGYFNDYDADGNQFPLAEMDPLTFFSTFNRNQAVGTRIAIVEAIKNEWGLDAPVPQDFDGVPQANAQNSWYFSYKKNREPHAVALLWRAAREACSSTFRSYDAKLFDETLDIRFVGLAKLSFGLFWLNPKGFLGYDANTKDFLGDRGVAPVTTKDAAGYFDWVRRVAEVEGEDFPKISVDSYEAAPDDVLSEESREVDAGTPAPKTWVIALGSRGEMWDDCRRKGIAAIGWDELGDLRQYADKEEIRDKLRSDQGVVSSKKNDTLACWQFANSIRPGDAIFVKQGRSSLLGYGVVTGDYEFDESRPRFKHTRSVDWQNIGEWTLPADTKHALKTLTDITRYPDYVGRLRSVVGSRMPEPTARVAEEPSRTGVAYWWLNANPKIWDLRKGSVGSTQAYTTHNEAGNKRQKFKYFAQVKAGDILIGYITTPDKEIAAICEVTRGVYSDDGRDRIEFRKIEQLKDPVTWEELKAEPALANCEPLNNNQGSLFAVNPSEYEVIRSLIDERALGGASNRVEAFSVTDALKDLFMAPEALETILARLKRKKAVILQGPPGVGKTFVAKRLAYAQMEERDEKRVVMVQFHPNYAYEDFVQGYRPSERGLERRDGVFYRFVRLARNNPDKDWFFIIDEINRGNLAKIFGELLMLIEADKRGLRHAIPLTYSDSAAETFHLPENLNFIGTMNTADRSLAMVDYALRRRFSFVTLHPELDSQAFGQWLKSRGAGDGLVDKIKRRVGEVNKVIAQERDLGPGFQIGHSFFCPPEGTVPDDPWFREVVHGEIKPLLEEYFESRDKVNSLVQELLA
jgi:5-methylcytosine-specific restriction protein B